MKKSSLTRKNFIEKLAGVGAMDDTIKFTNYQIDYKEPIFKKYDREIEFESCDIEHLELKDSRFKSITFHSACKIKSLIIDNCSVSLIQFIDFAECIDIVIKKPTGRIIVNSGTFANFQILDSGERSSVVFVNDNPEVLLKIKLLIISGPLMTSLTGAEIDFLIIKDFMSSIHFGASEIHKLHYIDPRNNINLEQRRFKELLIQGSADVAINLINLELGALILQNFVNSKEFNIKSLSALNDHPSHIIFDNSILTNANFENIDFSQFAYFKIEKSSLINLDASYVTWPKEFIGDTSRLGAIYRDLKVLYHNKHDNVNVLKFKALEFKTYRNRKDFSCQDRWIFRFNDWSNQHGQNYVRPFVLIWVVNLITFLIYAVFDNSILKEWGFYFNLFNPVRRIDFISDFCGLHENRNVVILIDFLSRGIISYLIFQTIAAFRKFSK